METEKPKSQVDLELDSLKSTRAYKQAEVDRLKSSEVQTPNIVRLVGIHTREVAQIDARITELEKLQAPKK